MKTLARWAARFGSPHPFVAVRSFNWSFGLSLAIVAVLGFVLVFSGVAFAQAAMSAPVGDATTGGFMSLWGPFCGVIASLVIFFDRVAKVIPNGTTGAILKGIRIVSTVLGVKVPDRQ
jgi:hypothetical protein